MARGSIVQNALFARQAAMEGVDSFLNDRARMTAGNALAAGDTGAASNVLLQRGMLDEGHAVQKIGQQEQTRQARVRGAQAYAKRDYSGARDAFASVGDVANIGAVDEAETARRKEQLGFTLDAARGLKTILAQRSGQDVLTAFDRLAPVFGQMGSTPQQLQQFRTALATDPQGFLDTVEAIAGDELQKFEVVNLGDGGVGRFEKNSGRFEVLREPQQGYKPDWRERTLPDGSTEWFDINKEGGGASAPGGPAPNADAVQQTIASLVPGVRVTSGRRDPEKNKAVGGAPNSFHLRGQAFDLVPPPGMSMAELAQTLEATGQFVEVIDEGDHVHVAWNGSGQPYQVAQAGGVTIRGDAPKPESPTGMTPAQERQASVQLRKEFNGLPDVKQFYDVANSYEVITRLGQKEKPSAADDLSFIFSYMKMLDPGSVVREGEFANAQNATGVPDMVRNAYNRALNGNRLNPKQRGEFIAGAQTVYEARKPRYDQLVAEYQGYASDLGLDGEAVIRPRAPAGASPAKNSERPNGIPTEAQKGKDGQWYYPDPTKPGSFPRLVPIGDGRWKFKASNGKWGIVD